MTAGTGAAKADTSSAHATRIAEWAVRMLADPGRRPAAVAHPLGFLCFPLSSRETALGVCVHVWLPQLPPGDLLTTPIHAHSWDLLSYILVGSVGNERVRTTRAPAAEASHRIYRVHSSDGGDEVLPTDEFVHCEREAPRYAGAGQTYRLPGGQFHATAVADGTAAATVLIAKRLPGGRDRALGPVRVPPPGVSPAAPRRAADPGLSSLALEILLDQIPIPR